MSGNAAAISVTEVMLGMLEEIAAGSTTAVAITRRARVVLLGFKKYLNQRIAEFVGLERRAVGRWRQRWRDSYPALLSIQINESSAQLKRSIIACLSDAPRTGSPGKFTPEQIISLIHLACEIPAQHDRPVTTWTGRELADEFSKKRIRRFQEVT